MAAMATALCCLQCVCKEMWYPLKRFSILYARSKEVEISKVDFTVNHVRFPVKGQVQYQLL